jgi:plastocyanin
MKRPLTLLAIGAVSVFALACSAPSNAPGSTAPVDPDALTISARDLAFSTDELSASAGEPFQIVFDNQESAPHNVSIYRDASLSEAILVEEPFSGPRIVTYEVPALAAGQYVFRCDVHLDMRGTLTTE